MAIEWTVEPNPDLESLYQDAYGAVVFGCRWNGADVDEVTKDEALDIAARFLKLLSHHRKVYGEAW